MDKVGSGEIAIENEGGWVSVSAVKVWMVCGKM